MAKIGLFGGAFDPIHHGHLAVAMTALKQLALDQIRFIPCADPVHKAHCIATAEQRAFMISLAILDQPAFRLERCELDRASASYSIDTIEYVSKEFGSKNQYFWLMGEDELQAFKTWHRWQDILARVDLIVVNRATVDSDALATLVPELTALAQASQHQLWRVTMAPQPQASRLIRSSGQALTDLPPLVADYIQAHHLYQKK